MASLLCRQSPDTDLVGKEFGLVFTTTHIGKSLLADIRVRESSICGRSIEVRRQDEREFVATPLNGGQAFINNENLNSPSRLNRGDRLQIGETVFEFLLDDVVQQQKERSSSGSPTLFQWIYKLAFGTLASRALGFLRVMIGAVYFGAGAAMDAFVTAFTIPSLFRQVLGEATMEGAFLTTFRNYISQGRREDAWRLASTVCNLLAVSLSVAVLLLYLLAPALVALIAPGLNGNLAAQAVQMTRIMCPFALFIGMAAFFGSLLLARSRPYAYSLAPTLFNLGQIAAIILLYRTLGIYAMAVGVVIGGIGQMLVQIHGFARAGDKSAGYRPIIDWQHPGLRKVVSLMGPIFLTSAIDKLGEVMKRFVASYLIAGSLAAYNYALRLALLPHSAIAQAISRAMLPVLTDTEVANNRELFRNQFISALNMCGFIMIPMACGIGVLAIPIVETTFAYGSWFRTNPQATSMTAIALIFFAFNLVPMGATSILVRVHQALLDTRTPLIAGARGLYINLGLSIVLATGPMGHAGLAAAVACDYIFQSIYLFVSIRRRLTGDDGDFPWLRSLFPLLKMTVCAMAMGTVIYISSQYLWKGTEVGALKRLLSLAALTAIGAFVYGLLSWGMKIPEMNVAIRRIRRLWVR